jgi:nucleotide-binding universal stress UspA family protein
MTKRVLLTTDFSQNSKNAMSYALKLYEQDNCEFYVLNAYSIEPYTMEMSALATVEASKEKSIKGLTRILAQLQISDKNPKHQFHMVSECGALVDSIKSMVDTYDIEMVIMGTKGDTDSRTEIYGSQTILAMEKIRTCPVLAIPAHAQFKDINTIVFPTGYHTTYKRREFQYLVDIIKKTQATLHIFHVMDKEEGLTQDQLHKQRLLKDYFEGLSYKFHMVKASNVQDALNAYIKETACDMVVFINKKHGFLRWFFSKPMAKHLTYYANIPILALHDFSLL